MSERGSSWTGDSPPGVSQDLLDETLINLGGLLRGKINSDQFNQWLEQSGNENLLTTPRRDLKGKSLLSEARRILEIQKNEEKILEAKKAEVSRKKIPRASGKRKFTVTERTKAPLSGFAVLDESSSIDCLNPNIKTVHLTQQRYMSKKAISQILDICPNLETIQAAPSWHKRMLQRPGVMTLLDENSVQLRKRRIRDSEHYDETDWYRGDFEEKRGAFKSALEDPDKRSEFSLLEQHGLVEPVIARLYFEREMTTRDIARELDMDYRVVDKTIRGILHWSGLKINDRGAKSRISMSIKRAEKYELMERRRKQFERKYRVGNLLPPDKLRSSNWDNWKSIQEAMSKDPKILDQLNERDGFIIINYYQIQQFGGKSMTLGEISKKYSITPERVRQLQVKALKKLGLSSE